jgi:hypothetical protein
MSKYSQIFAIIGTINKAGGNVTYKELVKDFTDGRTTSLSDLSAEEVELFTKKLSAMAPRQQPVDYSSDPLDATRKAIISQFKSIGRTAADAKAWAEKYGVNGVKRDFNDYTGQELFILLQNSKKIKAGFVKKVNKKVHGLY